MTASILGGTPKQAMASLRRVRSTESYSWVRSIKHKYREVSISRASSCSSSYYEHHVNRRSLGSGLTLFLQQNVLAFAMVTQATRDDIEEYFAGVSHERDATIIATISPIFVFVKHLNRCIVPFLRHATSPPHNDDDIVELSESIKFS